MAFWKTVESMALVGIGDYYDNVVRGRLYIFPNVARPLLDLGEEWFRRDLNEEKTLWGHKICPLRVNYIYISRDGTERCI